MDVVEALRQKFLVREIGVSVTFPSAKRLSPLTRHDGTGSSTPFGRTCRAFQCALDLVLERLAAQRPATVNSISNLAKFARIQLATEKLPVSLLPFLCCIAEPLVLLVGVNSDPRPGGRFIMEILF